MIAAGARAYYLVVISLSASKCCALSVGLGSLTIAPWARAEPGARLLYSAPESCPARETFVAAVAARGTNFEADAGSAREPRTFHVSIRQEGAAYIGSLRVDESQSASSARELHADTCAEVVDALAVVSAIALREAPAPAPESTAAIAVPETPTKAGTPAAPEPQRGRLRTIGQFGAERVAVNAGSVTFDRDVTLTLSGGFTLGVVPSLVLPRFDLTLTRANFVTLPESESYLVGGILRARWTILGPGTHRQDGFATDVVGLKAGFSGCSSLVYDQSGFVALLCAEFGAGVLSLETQDETGAITESKTVGLGSAGLEADVRYNLGKHFHLGFRLGGEAWLGEGITAQKPDGSQLFKAGVFNGYAQLGLGLNF